LKKRANNGLDQVWEGKSRLNEGKKREKKNGKFGRGMNFGRADKEKRNCARRPTAKRAASEKKGEPE